MLAKRISHLSKLLREKEEELRVARQQVWCMCVCDVRRDDEDTKSNADEDTKSNFVKSCICV